ncbi:MAG TPA: alpha/beta hydrolase [Rhodanobacteraceae bacterium]|nr:alpha/beta hydrolase [Rhodanobacteraceae bacterium]
MNIRWATSALIVVAGIAHAAAGLAAPATAQCRGHGAAALDAFTHGRFGEVPRHFAPAIASKATADTLQDAWRQLEAAYGAFTRAGDLQPGRVDGHDVLAAPITFAHGDLDAVVSCDAADRIVEFRFAPPSQVGDAASNGKASPADAMARLQAATKAHEHAPAASIKARVGPDGVRVLPLDVPSPFGPLHGALTLPAGHGPFPAVVLVQGSGASDMDETIGPNKPFRDIADGLARAGIASLRYDKRTFTYAARSATNDRFTVDDEVTDDALAALHLLAQQKSIAPRRVFVLGHSEGAMLVPRIIQRDASVAGGIMLAAPARPMLAVAADQVRELAAKSGLPESAVEANLKAIAAEQALLDKADPEHPPQGRFGPAPQSWWLSLHDYHQVAVAKALKQPLLIAQGGRDFQVSPTLDFDAWKQALASKPGVTFHLYPGLGHLFRPAGKSGTVADYVEPGAVDPQVIADIADWIKAQPAH